MYFRLVGTKHSESILEISHDGASSAAFVPPKPEKPDALGRVGFRDFFVTPSGKIYDLLENQSDQGIAVIEFSPDGSVRRTVKPEVPERLRAESLAVFEDGTFLIEGYIHFAQGEDAAKSYVAVFDASGKLRKELTGFPSLDLDAQGKTIRDGGLAIGQDGNAYLLEPDDLITVVSATGEIARRIPYKKPDPAAVARRLTISDGLIAITVILKDGDNLTPRFVVIRADDGGTFGYYTLPDELHNPSALCFSRSDGFTFLKFQLPEHRLALIDAPLR